MSEIDLVSAIASHFPAYVIRSILSANVSTIQGALTFLRRLEALEPQELGQGRSEPSTTPERGNLHYSRQQNRERATYQRHPHDQRHVRHIAFNRGAFTCNNSRSYNAQSNSAADRSWIRNHRDGSNDVREASELQRCSELSSGLYCRVE
jgi:hypothetical protein